MLINYRLVEKGVVEQKRPEYYISSRPPQRVSDAHIAVAVQLNAIETIRARELVTITEPTAAIELRLNRIEVQSAVQQVVIEEKQTAATSVALSKVEVQSAVQQVVIEEKQTAATSVALSKVEVQSAAVRIYNDDSAATGLRLIGIEIHEKD